MPLTCFNGEADMRIIALFNDAAPVELILTPIGEPSRPPPIAPARGPPVRRERRADDRVGDSVVTVGRIAIHGTIAAHGAARRLCHDASTLPRLAPHPLVFV
jgi:hypothetical protein